MRVLVMAEGSSDEVLAAGLICSLCPVAAVVTRTRQLRGLDAVLRSVATNIFAAHYQHFDVMVMHFDLDDAAVPGNVRASARRQAVTEKIELACAKLKPLTGRPLRPRVVLMTPQQSSDAWFAWGTGGTGSYWERMPRRQVKDFIFGNPPIEMAKKATTHLPRILARILHGDTQPQSLSAFLEDMSAAIADHAAESNEAQQTRTPLA